MTNNNILSYEPIGGVLTRPGRGSIVTPPPVDPPPVTPGSYPGALPDGKYYLGVALGPHGNGSLTALKGRGANTPWLGDSKMSVMHDYAGDANVDGGSLDQAINAGLIPSQTFRMSTGTAGVATVASGGMDASIDACAATVAARAPWPVILNYVHEPKGKFTTATAQNNYRDAFRRIMTRFDAAGVTNVAWTTIFTCPDTFTSDDFTKYHPDYDWRNNRWFDNRMTDYFGADTYNPLPVDANPDGKDFSLMWQRLTDEWTRTGYAAQDGFIPEFGISNRMTVSRPSPSYTTWSSWGANMLSVMKANKIKVVTYWDNSGEIGRYTFGPRPASVPVAGTSPCSVDNTGDGTCSPATSYDTQLAKLPAWQLLGNDTGLVKWTP